jgi:hypothetical protein
MQQQYPVHLRSHHLCANTETPGPHRLQLKPERPEDIAYKGKLAEQKYAESEMGQHGSPASNEALLTVFQSLTKVLKQQPTLTV